MLRTVLSLAGFWILIHCFSGAQTTKTGCIPDKGQPLPINLTDSSAVDSAYLSAISTTGFTDQLDSIRTLTFNTTPSISVLQMVCPPMPESAEPFRKEGIVKLKGLVDSSGTMIKVLITRSDNMTYNKAALRAFMQWKFKPVTLHGRPSSFWTGTSFHFRWGGN